ncbi:MAG TPA: beta-N-acetylhexosaminidase [Bacillales bacterium]|nr:beta-N-acetylhexosaminidase [Bacillales bacterium]
MKKFYAGLLSLLVMASFILADCSASGQNASQGSSASENSAQKSDAGHHVHKEHAKQNAHQEKHSKDTGKASSEQNGDAKIIIGSAHDSKKVKDKTKDESKTKNHDSMPPATSGSDEQEKTNYDIGDMTLDEKIGQLVMVGINGTKANDQTRQLIQQYHVGGVILYGNNIQTPSQSVKLINQLKAINAKAENPLPLFISVDQEGGRVERMPDEIVNLPSNEKIGNVNDPHFSYKVGQLIGQELQDFGFNMDFAPVLDIRSRSAKSVIGDRSFSSDKQVVSRLGVATMRGIQSQNVVSVIKHFPGYGGATIDAHTGLPKEKYGIDRLMKTEWYPYQKAIAAGADTVMVTHILLPQLDSHFPASMSRSIITGMLRNKLGFDGVVITDDMTMGAIAKHYSIDQAAVQAVKAGADIVLVSFHPDEQISVIKALKHAVQNGDISEERINKSVERILRLKQKYHLSNQPTGAVDVNGLNQKIHSVLHKPLS